MNGLYTKITPSGPVGPLLTSNPNLNNPTRLTHSQALTCDQNHGYTAEQQAVNGGKMDKFVQYTETATCSPPNYGAPGLVMDYYDGNTVTGLWNYAQHYAMSDNNYDTTFGPSTPGALNLISGQTGGSYAVNPITGVPEARPHREPAQQRRPWHRSTVTSTPPTTPAPTPATPPPTPSASRPARTSVTCSTPRASPGAGSRAGSRPPGPTGRLRGLRLHPQEHRRRHRHRLLAAPRAVPVLQVHGQPQAPAAVVGGRHRPHRPGQPPVRSVRTSTPRSAPGTCRRSAS